MRRVHLYEVTFACILAFCSVASSVTRSFEFTTPPSTGVIEMIGRISLLKSIFGLSFLTTGLVWILTGYPMYADVSSHSIDWVSLESASATAYTVSER